ncbi:MAG: putative quinol monooxygenase [Sulfurospirillaceae bacterium]|jgi:quinol monooxygenase YgiN|nr:putative quinol monooxygenase [Sulfurospirillaceae bacterium]MDD2826738.1 putative quinol monooxygenase [Sulfurospirillaceae bacterium]
MKNIIVVATLTLKKSQGDTVLEALKALHKATHQEDKGCLQYDVHKDIEKENTYVFVEIWESEALLAEHMEKEHFHTYKAFMGDKVESMSIQKLEKIL